MFTQLTAAVSGLSSDAVDTGRDYSFGANVSDTTTLRQKLERSTCYWC